MWARANLNIVLQTQTCQSVSSLRGLAVLQSPTGSSESLCKRRANQETAERRWRQWDGLHTELNTNKHTQPQGKRKVFDFFFFPPRKCQSTSSSHGVCKFLTITPCTGALQALSEFSWFHTKTCTLRKHCAVRDSLFFFFLSWLKTLKIITRRSFGKGTKTQNIDKPPPDTPHQKLNLNKKNNSPRVLSTQQAASSTADTLWH